MIGVADITPHWQAQQLATEMVLQAGPRDLLAVIQVFRPDKPDHGIHQKRLEFAGHGVRPGLAGLLIDTVMGIGRQRAALAGFEIHHVVTHRAAVERQCCVPGLGQGGQIKSETPVRGFGAANGLEHQIHRSPVLDGFQGIGYMGQYAGLGGNLVLADHLIHQLQQPDTLGHVVRGRIDSDHRIAAAIQQPVQNAGGNACYIIRGMIGLEPRRHPPRQADGASESGLHPAFLRDQDQVLVAHDLAHSRRHLRSYPGADAHQHLGRGQIAQQPVPEVAHGQVGNRLKGPDIVVVENQPGNLILLVGDEGFSQKGLQGQLGQSHLGHHPFLGGMGDDAGQPVT